MTPSLSENERSEISARLCRINCEGCVKSAWHGLILLVLIRLRSVLFKASNQNFSQHQCLLMWVCVQLMRCSAWIETWHAQDMQDRVQALPKVQLSISGPQRSSHWFPLLTYSSIDTVTLCQGSLTQWILDGVKSLSVSIGKFFFFFFYLLVFMEIFSSKFNRSPTWL